MKQVPRAVERLVASRGSEAGARDSAPSPAPCIRIKSSLLEQAEGREPKAYGRGHSAGRTCPH